ncbi:MAG: TerC family protein [Burkholderiaceae bacterium]|nr:TerC family protein [Burkholderiaceae bacterium]
MIEYLATMHWGAVAQIIVIDILLGGDNAIVIALACRGLPPEQRSKGIFWGTVGAIGIRIALIAFAVSLLSLPVLRIVGGLLLVWIGARLVAPADDEGHGPGGGSTTLMGAVKTVILADLVMSFDNVVAIAGAAQQADPDHQMGLVIFGLLVSIPLIVGGSRLVITLIERLPAIVWAGGALLGWIGGSMVAGDTLITGHFGTLPSSIRYGAAALGALTVLLFATALRRRQARTRPEASSP